MSNTIDTNNIIKTVISDTKQTLNDKDNSGKSVEADAPSSNNLADSVSITEAAKKLASVEKLDRSDMPINDKNLIETIKREIANGTYQIDNKAIADKMIEFE